MLKVTWVVCFSAFSNSICRVFIESPDHLVVHADHMLLYSWNELS